MCNIDQLAEPVILEQNGIIDSIDSNIELASNSLKDNLQNNRFLSPNVDVFHTVRNFDFYAGLKGNFAGNWSYDTAKRGRSSREIWCSGA